MTRYTVMLFQEAYPEQIRFEKAKVENGIYIQCWLLNKDKEPHCILFSGRVADESKIEEVCQEILSIDLSKDQ